MIELSLQEGEELVRRALEKRGVNADQYPKTDLLNAVIGAMAIVEALQELGYRIAPPLKEVGSR
jgi:hypothetical protein